MLVGTGLTICPHCEKVVPLNFDFCVLCSKTFPVETLHQTELKEAA